MKNDRIRPPLEENAKCVDCGATYTKYAARQHRCAPCAKSHNNQLSRENYLLHRDDRLARQRREKGTEPHIEMIGIAPEGNEDDLEPFIGRRLPCMQFYDSMRDGIFHGLIIRKRGKKYKVYKQSLVEYVHTI